MKIEIYDAEKLLTTAEVTVRKTVNDRMYYNTEITRWDIDNVMQPFCDDEITTAILNEFIERRVFSYDRPDRNELLNGLGLDEYNPIEIAKVTHGIMQGDTVWMRFDDEDFSWEDANAILRG